ncbi:flavin mononucleotide reductase [Neokomagataea thailandica NBRC 106555]|uniref:Flavin reductase n=2 Tax=Neokomagataea TaxID=1223423 RepID=A0A4Y6V9M4_9PROT|nr:MULTISPECIES: flavin reductase family protein [Neokomagataea]QDH25301.1 flavin reductase [Neokomagataea tanensis]GBR52465.1 flavin mononucleotide reductase [Neokomagataea thailandica NBRC 106555]
MSNTATQPDIQLFREAMARLASAVTIITTDGENGRYGFTASAVSSVTDTPPTLLVCINRQAKTHPKLVEHGKFAVNLLSEGHEDLSNRFASSAVPMDERFEAGTWHRGEYNQPILDEALVSLECEISDMKDIGTHTVVFGKILSIKIHSENTKSLIWASRRYLSV